MGLVAETLSPVLAAGWRPPPRLLVSEWADQYRYLSPEASAEPGKWRNIRAPHLVAPMDALSPYDEAEKVVCKFSSQTGKTEVILNFIGYIIDLDPGPILAIQPNATPMGEAFSKDRINPMLRDSPTLQEKSGPLKSRASASTIMHKTFRNGHLTIAGANSPAGLASRPIRYLVNDELDRWEATKEGDPLLLARKRQQTFRVRRRAKELDVSSPTYDDIGISVEYDKCDQTYEWQLECQHCGETQLPAIENFSWDDDESTTRYSCATCGGIHSLKDESKVKASGRWVCTQEGPRRAVGYWMNQFASPFARWDDTIKEWIDAQGDVTQMQAVVNTAFARGWEGDGEKIEPHVLRAREEDQPNLLPDWVNYITIGADVQADRIETEVVGWNADNRESFSLAYRVLPGEPTSQDVWDDLLEFFREPWEAPEGILMYPATMCVDSGYFTQHVYEFIKRSQQKGIIPVKGAAGMDREQVDVDIRGRMKRLAKRLRTGKPPEILGVDAIKRTVYQYLTADKGGVGYCHFPKGRSDEYYQQLTGERLIVVQKRGKRPTRAWKPIHPNVEALDCRVYAYAALLLTTGENPRRHVKPQPNPAPNRPPKARLMPRRPLVR